MLREKASKCCDAQQHAGLAGAPSILAYMAQILECRPDSCLAKAMLLATRLDSACCMHQCWTHALNWRGTAGFLL
eukprot:1157168-Pelagomonas_calceolata.AAC.7